MAVNEITASRAEYALALSALGLKVSSFIPDRIVPPVVVLTPGSPYLEPATLADTWLMRFDVMVIASVATNVKATEQLEKALATIMAGNPAYARINTVGQPYALQTNNAEFLVANIAVDIHITI